MSRPSPKTSALRSPLDFVLGTLGAVRTLRVLANTTVPLSQSEVARRASVSASALPALLATLEDAGLIAYEGRGRTRQVRLHQRHPLLPVLGQLFRDERSRWQRIQEELRRVAQLNASDLICAWIAGPVAVRQDRFTDPIELGILSAAPLTIAQQEGARRLANIVQAKEHVIVSMRLYERADMLRFTPTQLEELKTAIVLFGPAPLDLLRARPAFATTDLTAPRDAARRSGKVALNASVLAARIAERLVREPEILTSALTYIDRRLPLAGDVERLALLEWQGVLDSLTARQIATLLREKSERADELRQNMPFLGALTDEERAEFLGDRPSAHAVEN